MTAAEIVKLLNSHPVVCQRLGIHVAKGWEDGYGITHYVAFNDDEFSLEDNGTPDEAKHYELWLLGAASEWCDEHDIVTEREATEHRMWYWFNAKTLRSDPHAYETRLRAYLAAIENHSP